MLAVRLPAKPVRATLLHSSPCHDLFGHQKAQHRMVPQFVRKDDQVDTPVILFFVNGEKWDENTLLGRLRRDFAIRCDSDMHDGPFKDTVRYFKETEEGRIEMLVNLTSRMQQIETDGYHRAQVDIAIRMLQNGISQEHTSLMTDLPLKDIGEIYQNLLSESWIRTDTPIASEPMGSS